MSSLQRVFHRGKRIADKGAQRLRRWSVPSAVRHVSGPRTLQMSPSDAVLVSLVRNGEAHVSEFLTHHLTLGVRHIVLLDNASTDRTISIAQRSDRVTVLKTTLPYKDYKYALKSYLFDTYSGEGWGLILDIDERFDFPSSDRLPLDGFLAYLNGRRFTGVICQTLDLFPAGSVQEWPSGGSALVAGSVWYDHAALRRRAYVPLDGNTISNPTIMSHSGGIRLAAFDLNVSLTKHPLLRKSEGARPSLSSSQWCAHARIADVSCVLLHYKFDRDFPEKCRTVAREETYFLNSREYKAYLRELERNPRLALKGPTAERLESMAQLVEAGFLVVSDAYKRFVQEYRRS
jgi:hypothetical protein